MLYEILIVVYLVVALILIGFILIQQGKGADMGASFGAGSSATIFGSSGSGNFMTKTTAILATGFFVISLFLGNLTAQATKKGDEWNNLNPGAEQTQSLEPTDVPVSDDNNESDVPN
ncbi:preprotein translocase subunit SecG [Thalassotalea litorea]|uniref:Protein-export membrane protein SecG n=1 Tax=Thalassotalea litorea TaxID=2020715 RepID=A0A5R9IEF7_9GAMM|nr:preprotein translocase subunit SecG [Thalassotalea litorea]TLU62006.1 preprotein translocase subunit SecG [Thalassotalea litorea]